MKIRREDSREGSRLPRKRSGRIDAPTRRRNREKSRAKFSRDPTRNIIASAGAGFLPGRFVGRWVRRGFDFRLEVAKISARERPHSRQTSDQCTSTHRARRNILVQIREKAQAVPRDHSQRTLHSPRRRSLRSTWLSNCACACRLGLCAVA